MNLLGKKLKDRYQIYDTLGTGGAATVYLCRDLNTGKMVVTKIVHSNLVNDRFIGRFQREIDLLQKIDTPHIIKLFDWSLREFDNDVGHVMSYIVAEFVEGHTLAEIVDTQGALPETDAIALARQIAVGLDHIHDLGIIHRDIKAQNIMITPDNQAKIIDFGIAKGSDHATLTLRSHFAGTLYYAPPEQILEAYSVDHRADIYALGIVLYEMLTGELPVKNREMGAVAARIIAGELDPITGVSPLVESLVYHMLATRVEDRIPSANDVVQRIDDIGGPQEVYLPARPPSSTTMNLRKHLEQLNKPDTGELQPEPPQEPVEKPVFGLITTNQQNLPLTLDETIIGRSHPRHTEVPDIDLIQLDIEEARTVSRRHCRVYIEGDDYYIEDLNSMNGSLLNEDQLEPGVPQILSEGDLITAGQVKLLFKNLSG